MNNYLIDVQILYYRINQRKSASKQPLFDLALQYIFNDVYTKQANWMSNEVNYELISSSNKDHIDKFSTSDQLAGQESYHLFVQ
ncbi:unnamed protein product [Paramecium octaurelia]|uniref:Uncharacterized protein n=1 Tax=Paramecium octaurelia TaxID=43137 RepID=A0A8S1TU04_PAROT|nr:unnamed protein product [Paramecium octaurelia]